MRFLLSTVLAASVMTGPAFAAGCLRPADASAMDITALKTQLMVTALTCKADQQYNAFMRKYQGDLQREDKSLAGFFSRTYGRSGTKQRDDYVTNLANSQSQEGIKQGSAFCTRSMPVFEEVLALKSNAELPDYAAGRAGQQPLSVDACGSQPATRTTVHRTAARHR